MKVFLEKKPITWFAHHTFKLKPSYLPEINLDRKTSPSKDKLDTKQQQQLLTETLKGGATPRPEPQKDVRPTRSLMPL